MVISKTHSLSKSPLASFSQVCSLSFPLILSFLSGGIMNFCDRIFISIYSKEAFEGIAIASYLTILFQVACIRISSINQVFVANKIGAEESQFAGSYTWQMIWFSLFSMLITLPLSYFITLYLFPNETGKFGQQYFHILMHGNFLFPLGGALSAFFIGLGKTRTVTIATVVAHGINIGFNYTLIFGIVPFIPSLGIKGAAVATLIAQFVFCLILFCIYLKKSYRIAYGSLNWIFQRELFWNCFKLGIPRSLARFSALIAWNAAIWVINSKGGDLLLVLSVGSSLYVLFTCFNEGMGQALMTLFSYLIGRKNYALIFKGIHSACIFLLIMLIVMGIPLIFFSDQLICIFIHEKIESNSLHCLKLACFWLWIFLLTEGFAWISLSLMTSLGKTFYLLKMNLVINWPTIFCPIFYGYYLNEWTPDKLWLICSISCLVAGSLCFIEGIKQVRLFLSESVNHSEKRSEEITLRHS